MYLNNNHFKNAKAGYSSQESGTAVVLELNFNNCKYKHKLFLEKKLNISIIRKIIYRKCNYSIISKKNIDIKKILSQQ